MSRLQMFGGDWTEQKLAMLKGCLEHYQKVMKYQPFRLVYVDAFAGTGYRELKEMPDSDQLLFPELAEEEPQKFLEGSARIALQVEPPFAEYVFIEKAKMRAAELGKLKKTFPHRAKSIQIVQGDCNSELQELCGETDWRSSRAVLFLDPFGTQVDWETLCAVAETEAIDVWILFPLGMGVNRLLKRDGNIPGQWEARLDKVFGTHDWRDAFYRRDVVPDLFDGNVERTTKTADFDSIAGFWIHRLRSIFPGVAENPCYLPTRGNPLFLFCFAASNKKGAPIALRIAKHLLGDSGRGS